jgi:hypothetical protein
MKINKVELIIYFVSLTSDNVTMRDFLGVPISGLTDDGSIRFTPTSSMNEFSPMRNRTSRMKQLSIKLTDPGIARRTEIRKIKGERAT